jgi:hypothetical protein
LKNSGLALTFGALGHRPAACPPAMRATCTMLRYPPS